jgi:DNA polymerase-3 subunit epsilon
MNTTDRQAAINLAQDLLAARPVYLDTETTGLNNWDEIVDICILDADGQVLIDTLVKPSGKIPGEATSIHGITNAMVASAPTWPEIWPRVEAAITDRTVLIYNADFDVRLMQQTHRKHRLAWRTVQSRCIMLLYAQFYGEWDAQRRSFRWQKLELAGRQCGLKLLNTHRANDDAQLARAILQYMANVM